MPRRGGEADKLGNRYEGAWVIRHALYCIHDPTRSLTVEDIDEDRGRGSEFTYVTDGLTEVHQLKRQPGSKNSWTVKALAGLGIFSEAAKHVAAGRHYRFVSLAPCGALKELAERARKSADLTAFTRHWLTGELRPTFDELSAPVILGSAQDAWNALRGMSFEVHDETDIVSVNDMLAERSLEGATGRMISLVIGDVVLDHLGVRLTRKELVEQLASEDITPVGADARTFALEQVNGLTKSWRATVRRELLCPPIERVEAAQLIRELETSRVGLVIGTAGGGKSSVLDQAVGLIEDAGAQVLALRLDRLESFASTVDLGRQLGLDRSPATALALATDGRAAYLVIDQLDAVSLASGRMPQRFDVVVDLIDEALSLDGVRVILACREFDVENDHRIRALAERPDMRKVQVRTLSVEVAKTAVENMGLEPDRLTETQLDLLRTPLHLVFLASVSGQGDALSFRSRSSLLAAFWERKRQSAEERLHGIRFYEVLARVANAASDRQALSVPVEVLDEGDLIRDAKVLVSEHVLAWEGSRIAFFHEAFFDYTFARQWVSREESLTDFLLRHEQELFRRAQVRQILQHLHEREPDRFLAELEDLLSNPRIRFHIKEAAFLVFADLPDPNTLEAELALRTAATEPSWADWLWLQLGRPQWFRRFARDSYIAGWLDGADAALRKRAINIMASGSREWGDDVASLLETQSRTPEYFAWTRQILRAGVVHASRRMFDVLLTAMRDGAYEESEGELWSAVGGLARHRPEWAVEFLRARLVDHPAAWARDADGGIYVLAVRDFGASRLIRETASAVPLAFAEVVIPYLLKVMAVPDVPPGAGHFPYRGSEIDRSDERLDDALLSAAVKAVEVLAWSEPEAVRPLLQILADDFHESAQVMLYRAFVAGSRTFAVWAAEVLLRDARRFGSSNVSDDYRLIREVLETIAPRVGDEVHRLLEERVRDLRDPDEWMSGSGRAAFALLSALDEGRISAVGRRRLQEYRRKFGQEFRPEPRHAAAGMIVSPIGSDAVKKMTDDQWLKAMAKYDKSDPDWSTSKGGAQELSRQLQAQVADDPERFARLAFLMRPDFHPAYGAAILMGFGDSSPGAAHGWVFKAIRHIASWGHAGNDRWLGMALRGYFREVPLDMVELILRRAVDAADPVDDRPLFVGGNVGHSRAEILLMNGINTTRGSLAQALGDLLVFDGDGNRTELVRPYLDQMAEDPVLSVRACVAHTIAASLRHARPSANSAFERLIDSDDIVLAAHHVQQLMLYIGGVDPELIDPVIQRMLSSKDNEVREAGGEMAAFAALERERPDLLAQALDADVVVRAGLARICAARIDRTANVPLATTTLLRLLSDEDQDVRKAVAEVASHLRDQPLRPFTTLLAAIIDSPAYEHAMPQLLITLEHAPDRVDDLVLKAARRFASAYSSDTRNVDGSAVEGEYFIADLVVRGLAQSRNREHRAGLLDVLDILLESGVYRISEAIAKSERL